MSTTLQNSIWPNAGGTLGEIKTSIPDGITIKWPDGDALVGNVVYKDGLISGFVDTKALILNESRTTTIPYDYVDIALDHSMENNLTINKGERCKYLNVKYIEFPLVLPPGYTELEYLESSGTQWINLDVTVDDKTTLRGFVIANMTRYNYNLFGCQNPEYRLILGANQTIILVIINNSTCRKEYPTPDKGEIYFELAPGSGSVNGYTQSTVPYPAFSNISLFRAYGSSEYFGIAKFYNFEVETNGVTVLSLIPVLNADGVAGMWDKINGRFIPNAGTGTFGYRVKSTGEIVEPKTFSLRDPYYVAPSGVYARLVAENELEILADTEEITGDGWEHFADTAEAYEHFGIIPEEIEYQN